MNYEWWELEKDWYEYYVYTNTSLYKTYVGSKARMFSMKEQWQPRAEENLTEEDCSLLNGVSSMLLCHYCSKEHLLSMLILIKILSNQHMKDTVVVKNFFAYDGRAYYIKWGGFENPNDEAISKKVTIFNEKKERGDPFCVGVLEVTQEW